jgi:acetylglutamate kinase
LRIVLKIGGNEIDDLNFLDKVSKLASQIRSSHHKLVLVHGGGKEITDLLTKLSIETRFVGGLRYTDSRSLDAVEMILSGLINKRLVKALQRNGVNALGLSGIDGKILTANKASRDGEDIGLVGEVGVVNTSLLEELIEKFAVVLSPISADKDSSTSLNVNADYAAAAIASSLRSELVIFLSNVPGVLKDGTVIRELGEEEFLNLKGSRIIAGGMIPKIEAALSALKGGARRAFITDSEGASKLVSGQIAGTQVMV